jgi:hypothetical protein
MIHYEVGKPYPGIVPQRDAALFELSPGGGMELLIQCKNPSDSEAAALKAGFNRYSYYEYRGPYENIFLACWVFKFPAPVGYMDVTFHADRYPDDRGEKFLAEKQNLLTTFILKGNIISHFFISGLQFKAMDLFCATVRQQINERIPQEQYDASVDDLYRLSSEEIFMRGNSFAHKLNSGNAPTAQTMSLKH